MPDLNAINLHLQERLEDERREEFTAAEAAVRLSEAGLLPDGGDGTSLCSLLRACRIAGQEQRPNEEGGTWWIRRLARSREVNATYEVQKQIQRYLPINRSLFGPDWPIRHGRSEFLKALGSTVATFGCLEDILARACYCLASGTERFGPEPSDIDESHFRQWLETLDRSLTDGMGALTGRLEAILKEDTRIPHCARTELIERLNELRSWRNALCHGSWSFLNKDGSGRLQHYKRLDGMPWTFSPNVFSVEDLDDLRMRVADIALRVAEIASVAGAGFVLTAMPRQNVPLDGESGSV